MEREDGGSVIESLPGFAMFFACEGTGCYLMVALRAGLLLEMMVCIRSDARVQSISKLAWPVHT